MAYSKDFRLKVLAFVDRGESEAAVAQRFDIGERTVRRFKQRRRLTGDVTADKTGPKGPMKLTPQDDALMFEQVRRKPGITAKELRPMLGVEVSISAICRRLTKLGLTLKKSH
jgi:transposase